eukprot:25649-Chlamydomonas_euryale.AAC.1
MFRVAVGVAGACLQRVFIRSRTSHMRHTCVGRVSHMSHAHLDGVREAEVRLLAHRDDVGERHHALAHVAKNVGAEANCVVMRGVARWCRCCVLRGVAWCRVVQGVARCRTVWHCIAWHGPACCCTAATHGHTVCCPLHCVEQGGGCMALKRVGAVWR